MLITSNNFITSTLKLPTNFLAQSDSYLKPVPLVGEAVDTIYCHIDTFSSIFIQLLDLLSTSLRGSEFTSFISLLVFTVREIIAVIQQHG